MFVKSPLSMRKRIHVCQRFPPVYEEEDTCLSRFPPVYEEEDTCLSTLPPCL